VKKLLNALKNRIRDLVQKRKSKNRDPYIYR